MARDAIGVLGVMVFNGFLADEDLGKWWIWFREGVLGVVMKKDSIGLFAE